ncbi:phosphoethanolamine transferase [Pseudoduganella namucuonensis]|uniref:Phosphatidylethanolamine:Kdo2-lipid A phosphoethanolamine transferase n=1 Tax=Pseudoduganella namucuonensis TaxID=1035707 RepID=A0A1I7K193_9BURK|nr:phosphoethanolamine--lipid A transferase [Pseudoduganella namucuonensis]SFU91204.1 phosphatidylethanolamine:Kdo2-lipid A phosphoethanolamine transferase [Pseudoduganella namucuonensis]
MNHLPAPRLRAYYLPFLASLFLVAAFNHSFWSRFALAVGGTSAGTLPLLAATFLMLVFAFTACLSLVNFKPIAKPVIIALFVATAAVSYFMNQYGVQIDKAMVQNVVETDVREAGELLNWRMMFTMAVLGVLPSLLLLRTRLEYAPARRHLAVSGAILAGSLALAVAILLLFFKSYAPAVREHRELRFLLTPTNYIQAVNGYVRQKWAKPQAVAPLGTDAVKGTSWAGQRRRTVTVIVVGETARAMNFSLNKYPRETNPLLSRQPGLINFSNVSSCGTSTAVSVPCVFSDFGREEYSDAKGAGQEGLLDVLNHAGFSVLWRDNNSGCKGVCARVDYEDLSEPVAGNPLCNSEECYDERLLENLPAIIHESSKDLVVVLHQKGSHGPAYWKRYPAEFLRFGPVCRTNDLEKCTQESIVAAYDNTILYTDYLLDKTIKLLKQSSEDEDIDTSMIYFSDHGESLGEKNMYLHGAPYFISPPEQRRVPFMLWFSERFADRFKVDTRCVAARASQSFSHDNVFHSVLGLLDVSTAVYNPGLDLFHACSHDT